MAFVPAAHHPTFSGTEEWIAVVLAVVVVCDDRLGVPVGDHSENLPQAE